MTLTETYTLKIVCSPETMRKLCGKSQLQTGKTFHYNNPEILSTLRGARKVNRDRLTQKDKENLSWKNKITIHPPVRIVKRNLSRLCKKCSNSFIPESKFQRICKGCFKETKIDNIKKLNQFNQKGGKIRCLANGGSGLYA